MTPPVLRLGLRFDLPLDVVTEATAIVATRGAGKSSTGAVLVEETVAAGVPVVVIDWTGVFWGLRSGAKGDDRGLPVYVLGGPHGDVPLEAGAGHLIADLVVESGHSFVLDLSDMTKGQMRRFAADLLERLYERKARARTTLLLVIDEAHELAPQSPRGGFKGDAARLIGAMEQVVALGRSRGIGVVLITQRTQALNKAVLDLIESLIVMRMLSPRAVDAVRGWIVAKNEDDDAGVLASLPSLPTGTAWVWSPLRGILTKVPVRRIRTFDSYATPRPGEVRVEPKARRELDLAALGERIAATVEQAKANDPAELRRRIAALERELANVGQREPNVVTVEVPVMYVPDEFASLMGVVGSVLSDLKDARDDLGEALTAARNARESVPLTVPPPDHKPAGQGPVRRNLPPVPSPPVSPPASDNPRVNGAETPRLKAGARRMLDALVGMHPLRLTRVQVGTTAHVKHTGGTFGTYWSHLTGYDLITSDDGRLWYPTDAGFAAAGAAPGQLAADPAGMRAQWLSVLKAGARRMLTVLLEEYPDGVTRDELGRRAEIAMTGGTFGTYLSTLRANGLILEAGGVLYAAPILFGQGS